MEEEGQKRRRAVWRGGGLLKQRGKERAIKLRGKGFAGNTRQKERLQASFVESRERRGETETQKFYPAAF